MHYMLKFREEAKKLAKELGEPLYLTREDIYKRDMERLKEREKLMKQYKANLKNKK